jgi:hypothetical protein
MYWDNLSGNLNAIELLKENPKKINWDNLSGNINAIELLKENLEKINWDYLSGNPNAIELLKENLEKINWDMLSANINAIELLKENPEKIDWYLLSINSNAIELLKENLEKIDWDILSGNEKAIELLKQNFTRCEKCGKSINKKVDSSHNCKYLYFNYRAINGITENSDRNISIKRQFNLNDNSIISPILKIEIDKYLTENPIREVPIHSKIILAENQNLSTKDLSEVFQPPTLSELLSSDDFIFTFGKFKNKKHRIED